VSYFEDTDVMIAAGFEIIRRPLPTITGQVSEEFVVLMRNVLEHELVQPFMRTNKSNTAETAQQPIDSTPRQQL
jgi:hypothetical protein